MLQTPALELSDTEIESGYRIRDDKLDPFKSVFRSYANVIEAYSERFKKLDAPYFYNERANISIFAAAAWLSGNVAIEEYSCTKGDSQRSRADIFIQTAAKGFQVEAKRMWINGDGQARVAAKQIERKLNAAVLDVVKIDKESSHHRLGCLFVVPYYKKEPYVEELKDFLLNFFKQDFHAATWCFSKTYRRLTGDDGNFYPGVALFLKRAT